jgi:hypothetical protein
MSRHTPLPWKRILLNISGLAILLTLILYGGPMLSRKLDRDYKNDIDKNGKILRAVIISKRQHKGHLVSFQYSLNGKNYKNEEQDASYYEYLDIGDSVLIKVDTTSPKQSYIFDTGLPNR